VDYVNLRALNRCGTVDWLHPADATGTPRPSVKLQAPTSAASIPRFLLHNPHNLCHPHISYDPRIRPLAGSTAAAAGCAPPYCVSAPRPELEKGWLFGRRSRPLSLDFPPISSLPRHYVAGLAQHLARRPRLRSPAFPSSHLQSIGRLLEQPLHPRPKHD
jgi:hypothetical protein